MRFFGRRNAEAVPSGRAIIFARAERQALPAFEHAPIWPAEPSLEIGAARSEHFGNRDATRDGEVAPHPVPWCFEENLGAGLDPYAPPGRQSLVTDDEVASAPVAATRRLALMRIRTETS